MDVHVLVAKRNQEAIEAGLRANPIANLHFIYVPVSYEWAKQREALHYICWQLAALKVARELTQRLEFQVAHHVTYASVHVPSPLWRLGIPTVFGPVGGGQTAPASMLAYFGVDKSKERRRSALTKGLSLSPFHQHWLRRMSFILAANQDTLNIVKALGCKRASLMCDTAVPTEYFSEGPRKLEQYGGTLKLLWVGRMLARKALPLALDALEQVHRNVTLTIAGDGIEPWEVHQMIQARDLDCKVAWKGGRLTQSELRTAYAEHDALLFTSLRDSFGSQLLEAMAMGLPIITLDLHGAHDWVPDGASLKIPVGCPEETVRNLTGAIEKYFLLSPAARNQMSMDAWHFARMHTWAARAECSEQLYNQILLGSSALKSASASKVAPINI